LFHLVVINLVRGLWSQLRTCTMVSCSMNITFIINLFSLIIINHSSLKCLLHILRIVEAYLLNLRNIFIIWLVCHVLLKVYGVSLVHLLTLIFYHFGYVWRFDLLENTIFLSDGRLLVDVKFSYNSLSANLFNGNIFCFRGNLTRIGSWRHF
jgi:hypothetical protein